MESGNFTGKSTKEDDVGVCVFLLEKGIILSSSKNEKQEKNFVVYFNGKVQKMVTGTWSLLHGCIHTAFDDKSALKKKLRKNEHLEKMSGFLDFVF